MAMHNVADIIKIRANERRQRHKEMVFSPQPSIILMALSPYFIHRGYFYNRETEQK